MSYLIYVCSEWSLALSLNWPLVNFSDVGYIRVKVSSKFSQFLFVLREDVCFSVELLYRTDFFPGLGWMLLQQTWLELKSDWPPVYGISMFA